MKTNANLLKNEWPTIVAIIVFSGIFWSLRGRYWAITSEEPFSDIADYVMVGRRIAEHFAFDINDQYYAYFTPITPSLIAISILLAGDNYQWVFRILVQCIAFFGVLLLSYELTKLTGRKWISLALLFIVALSRPSIFWSLKLGTEALSEALLFCALGLSLRAIRTWSFQITVVAGMACMMLALNRPQFVPSVLLIAALFALASFTQLSSTKANLTSRNDSTGPAVALSNIKQRFFSATRDRQRLLQSLCFAAGLIIVWSPWIVRNYIHYGALVATATSGTEAFVWEYSGAPIRPGRYQELKLNDGTVLRDFDINKIRQDLNSSPNDYVRYQKFRSMAVAWLIANWQDLPGLFLSRLEHFISHNGASGLTKVPREQLFPIQAGQSPSQAGMLDLILLDKTPWVCFLALGGCAILVLRHGLAGGVIVSLCLLPWFVLATLIGYERTVESLVSMTLWLAVYSSGEILLFVAFSSGHPKAERTP